MTEHYSADSSACYYAAACYSITNAEVSRAFYHKSSDALGRFFISVFTLVTAFFEKVGFNATAGSSAGSTSVGCHFDLTSSGWAIRCSDECLHPSL